MSRDPRHQPSAQPPLVQQERACGAIVKVRRDRAVRPPVGVNWVTSTAGSQVDRAPTPLEALVLTVDTPVSANSRRSAMDAAPANRRSVELSGTRRGRNRPSSSDHRGQCRAVILEFYTTALQHANHGRQPPSRRRRDAR